MSIYGKIKTEVGSAECIGIRLLRLLHDITNNLLCGEEAAFFVSPLTAKRSN